MTDKYKETCTVVRDGRTIVFSSTKFEGQTDEGGENPQKQAERKALPTKREKLHAVTKIVKTCHVKFGILPYV